MSSITRSRNGPRGFAWRNLLPTLAKILRRLLAYVALVAIVAAMVLPIAWMFVSSFKGDAEVVAYPPTFVPQEPTVHGYERLFEDTDFPTWFGNTAIATIATTLLAVAVSAMGAYVLTRSHNRVVQGFSRVILLCYMIPQILLLIPIYRIIIGIKSLIPTPLVSLVVVYVATLLPYGLWTLRSYFAGIPHELEESALIDGCTRFQAFLRVILPQVGPGLIATAVFCFNVAWGEVLFATILLQSNRQMTLTPGIGVLYGSGDQGQALVLAASTLATLPVVILFFALQRYLVAGWGTGAVKG